MQHLMPVWFVSHGGGPWPYMEGPFREPYQHLEASLSAISQQLQRPPEAIVMISAHWETPGFSVASSAAPGMIYDYYGFPEYTYQIQYPAPGSPSLAARIAQLLSAGGLSVQLDPQRGFDHGCYSALKPMYPEANIPVVQVSLQQGLQPDLHLQMGQLLAPLRQENILIIGSGLSYHNLRNFGPGAQQYSSAFDAWLQETVTQVSPDERRQRLLNWSQAPGARQSHPREEHLLPLMVAVGAAQTEPGVCVYHEEHFLGGVSVSSFRFGAI
ncbi:MAG: DODA-type extradiol aromatic ring-opening family dioxygenase [Enterobacteriaceae bacterium]